MQPLILVAVLAAAFLLHYLQIPDVTKLILVGAALVSYLICAIYSGKIFSGVMHGGFVRKDTHPGLFWLIVSAFVVFLALIITFVVTSQLPIGSRFDGLRGMQ